MAAKGKSRVLLPPPLQAMGQGDFYPHRPKSVELRQTHISWVFLAGSRVYKVKKPVDFGFLDYSTLRKRSYWCRREVELNRRLAPKLYRGVEKIYRRQDRFSLEGPGRVVEYAVVMKRLPEERLLSSLLAAGDVTLGDMENIARHVALFHRRAAKASSKNGSLAALRRNLDENFRQTEPFIGRTVSAADYEEVYRYNRTFLKDRRPLLGRRIREGRIRDCHGDLHAEHICLDGGITIFDCLEFSGRLRQCDVAAETAFLYMDLLYHGHPRLARRFAEAYIRFSGDWEVRPLLSFYACYRAVVREKVESFRFADPGVPEREKGSARHRAARYFQLARDLARRDGRPRLFVFGGLPGTGKSTFAAAWSQRLGLTHLRSDVIRKEITGTPLRPAQRGRNDEIYTEELTHRTYHELVRRAGPLLRGGHSVVLDATFTKKGQRSLASSLARETGALLVPIECRCPAATVRRRLARRTRSDPSDADWRVYLLKKKAAEPFPDGALTVATQRPAEEGLAGIAAGAYPL